MSRLSLTLLTLLAVPPAAVAQSVERFEGTARSTQGELVYREQHEVTYAGGAPVRSVTHYTDPSGKPLAELRSDYRQATFAPSYSFVDARGRTRESASITAGVVELQADGERRRFAVDPREPPPVLGQGLHQLVRARLEELARGARLVVQFGIPSRLSLYDFRIERKESADPAVVRLGIRVDNRLLALLAPSIECDYERATRRLLRYRGVSNLPGPDGKPMDVVITYTYPDGAMADGRAP